MTSPPAPLPAPVAHTSEARWAPSSRIRVVLGSLTFAALALGAITYAKWWPYAGKVSDLVATGHYKSKSLFARAGSAPNWHTTWHFLTAYGKAIWIALIAGLLIGAGVQTLLPRRSLSRLMGSDRTWGSSLRGGLFGLPCLMCTCCSSPITVSLRRAGTSVAAALSYWLANPLLNPAVLIILAIVLPWPFVVVRIVFGAFLVFCAAPLLSRLGPSNAEGGRPASSAGAIPPATDVDRPLAFSAATGALVPSAALEGTDAADMPSVRRYLTALARLAAVLVPEYAVVVLVIGAFSGWLLPFTHISSGWVPGATVLAAVAGTLLVVPTAGEIAVIVGLVALGAPLAVLGALVIALPAMSLPSITMVGRSLSWRVTGVAALAVMAAAVAAGILVTVL